MRAIKFRAWDGEMLNNIIPTNHSEIIEVQNLTHIPRLRKVIDIMQYTGLKDKNGKESKEIYQSDLFQSQGEVGEIKQHESGEWYIDYGEEIGTESLLDTLNRDGGEVIGNIYENPELLPA